MAESRSFYYFQKTTKKRGLIRNISNWPTKKLGEMKKAWLVQWDSYAQNKDEYLQRFGINKKVIDIISVRKDFDKILEIAKNI